MNSIFENFGGSLLSSPTPAAEDPGDDVFKKFGGKRISTPTVQDNTIVVNPVVPKNNTPQEINRSKQAKSINQDAQEKDAYYNPPVRKNITSGDAMTDFLYRNQWLINTPVVGNIIKNKAYDIARKSSGFETLDKKQLDDINNGKQVKSMIVKYKDPYYRKGLDTTYEDGIKDYKGQDLTNDAKNHVNLLDQYFGKISLPKSNYAPTSDYLKFLPSVSIKGNFEKSGKKNLSDWVNYIKEMSGAFNGIDPKSLDYMKKPIYSQEGNDSPISLFLGTNLNGHKLNIAYDKERKLPYISISDAWDFAPKDYALKNGLLQGDGSSSGRAYIQASLMHKAGTPFKVYDRFYFDPKTNDYIPDSKVPKLKK